MRADVWLNVRRARVERVKPVALRPFRSAIVDMTVRFPTVELLIECESCNVDVSTENQSYSLGAGYCVLCDDSAIRIAQHGAR